MSFRIEEKLSIDNNKIIDFKSLLVKKKAKRIYQSRMIQSLYFENLNRDMYTDSMEGVRPRKKIRVRNYPNTLDANFYLETKISSVEGRFKTRKIVDEKKFNYFKAMGILDPQYGLCKPSLYVTYDREYFKIDDIKKCLKLLEKNKKKIIFPVSEYSHPPERAFYLKGRKKKIEFINKKNANKTTQNFKKNYHDAGQFYCAKKLTWLKSNTIHNNSIGFEIPKYRTIDIDDHHDWLKAKVLFKGLKYL